MAPDVRKTWLRGALTSMRPAEATDVEFIVGATNRIGPDSYLNIVLPRSIAKERERQEQMQTRGFYQFIVEKLDGEPVGLFIFQTNDRLRNIVDLGLTIFESGQRGRGYGTDATRVLVSAIFRTMPVTRIQSTIFVENEVAIRVSEAVGFRREGTLRSYYYHNGRFHDVAMMAIIFDDWARLVASADTSSSAVHGFNTELDDATDHG